MRFVICHTAIIATTHASQRDDTQQKTMGIRDGINFRRRARPQLTKETLVQSELLRGRQLNDLCLNR